MKQLKGIDLNKPITYFYSSLRFFSENEYHINRICNENVLLLVFEGCLRFSENEIQYEIHSGEYFIQQAGGEQRGNMPSDSPKYLYVHFLGEWSDNKSSLPRMGFFSYSHMKELIYNMDRLSHGNFLEIERISAFYGILNALFYSERRQSEALKIGEYITERCTEKISLDEICAEFHFSKNHIIKMFKEEYEMTPIAFLSSQRLMKAEYLLEVTALSAEEISQKSGYLNYSHFYRQFYKKHGISPIIWRNERHKKYY